MFVFSNREASDGLNEVAERGWVVIDMKMDWKRIHTEPSQ